eukprot:1143688-Pelagomonas_calceolata.AAC.1
MRSSANAPLLILFWACCSILCGFFTEATICLASPSSVEPARERFHVYEEKEGRESISLDGAPLYGDVICILTIREANSGVRLFVKVFDGVNGIRGEAKVKHDPKQFAVVCCVEGRGKIHNQGIDISVEEFGIFKSHNTILELVDGVCVLTETCLHVAQQGVTLCIFIQGSCYKACPEFIKGVG